MTRTGWMVWAGLAAGLVPAVPMPATAVVVLDETWQEAGGAVGAESAGFGRHHALAHGAPFEALVNFSDDGGNEWGVASGTWIGNDEVAGYVLTAGHNFTDTQNPADYLYRSQGGTLYQGVALFVHPLWNGKVEERTGYDLAIVRLDQPITDAGPPPVLYDGAGEQGMVGTLIGFGARGIGSTGEQDVFFQGDDKAAAQNRIDAVMPAVEPVPEEADADAGNHLGIDFDAADGQADNRFGESVPVNALEGVLGSGDSGGSLWVEFPGGWRLVGVASNGDGDTYGAASYFARVAPQKDWIVEVFPGARFAGD